MLKIVDYNKYIFGKKIFTNQIMQYFMFALDEKLRNVHIYKDDF